LFLTNMKKIKLAYNKIFWVCVGLLIISGLGFQFLTPSNNTNWQDSTSLVQQNLDFTHSTFKNINFTGKEPNIPKELPTIGVEKNLSFKAWEKIVAALKLEKSPDDENLWSNQDWSLTIDQQNNLLLLTSLKPISINKNIDKSQAINAAYSWLKKLDLPQNMVVDEQKIEYFTGQYELRPSQPGLAGLIQIPFGYTTESLPLFIGQDLNAPFVLTLDSEYNLTKLVAHPIEILGQKTNSKLPTLSVQEAIKNIEQKGVGSIINLTNPPAEYSLVNIEQAKLTKVQLEYRLENDGLTAIPYYNFGGTITTNTGETIEAVIITPAVKI